MLLSLSAFAAIGALAVANRGYAARRAELALATAILWLLIILAPILALGWASALTRANLAFATFGTASFALVAGLAGPRPRQRFWGLFRGMRSLLMLPWDALRECRRHRSTASIGVLAAIFVILWTAWLTYLAPSSGWDGIWYHDTIVGLALQNHGFSLVDVPPNLEFVNGYPKTSECLSLWWVVFTDRRLIELSPTATAPILLLGMYLLARRHMPSRVLAMGYSTVLLLLPAIALQLRSSYVDGVFLAVYVAAAYFVSRPRLRGRDFWLAGVALGLLGGMKGTGMVLVPLLFAVLMLRGCWLILSQRRLGIVLHGLGALLVIAALMGPTYLRNYLVHDNPAWPVTVENDALGITWSGVWEVSRERETTVVLKEIFSPPGPDGEFHDTRRNGYGNGPPFVILPLALWALAVLPLGALRRLWLRLPSERCVGALMWIVLPTAVSLKFSPALWWARFNLHGVVALFLLAIWWLGRPSRHRLAEGFLGALVVTSVMTLWWSNPGWEVDREKALELAAMSAEDRAAYPVTWYFGEPATMRARDTELGPGDLVAFNNEFGFPAILFNESLSSGIVYVPFRGTPTDYLRALDDAQAEWNVVRRGGAEARVLVARPDLWQEVGATSDVNVAYRRTSLPWTEHPAVDGAPQVRLRGERPGPGERMPVPRRTPSPTPLP